MFGICENNPFHLLAARAAVEALSELMESEHASSKPRRGPLPSNDKPTRTPWTRLKPRLWPVMRALGLVGG